MHRLILIGAGKIGSGIARLLASTGDYELLICDRDPAALEKLELGKPKRETHAFRASPQGRQFSITASITIERPQQGGPAPQTRALDITDSRALGDAMRGYQTVVSACTAECNQAIAHAAAEAGLSYFDLTEDNAVMHAVKDLAKSAKPDQVFMPQCGLAPGFISIVANSLAQQLDEIDGVKLRVGALPEFPSNALKYNLTWSTDGLINEYANKCEAIENGRPIEVVALEGLEHLTINGTEYEAFNTSGGAGTLPQTLAGRVRSLNYKTLRYPGHRDLMAFLMNELRLKDRRELLKEILDRAIPTTAQDIVVTFCSVTGNKDGRRVELTDARRIRHTAIEDESWTAIRLTTAAGICAVVDLHAIHQHFPAGFARQEQVPLEDFLSNRFGKYYHVSTT